jgi:hypothetical protein
MFDVTWLRVQPTWVLADALAGCCDALEGGRLSLVAMVQAWRYMMALRRELVEREQVRALAAEFWACDVEAVPDGRECHILTY